MLKAVNLSKTISYELDVDPDKGTENSTKFILGALDARVLAQIRDKATAIPVSSFAGGTDGYATLKMNEMNFDIVVYGLKNVINYDKSYSAVSKQLGGKTYLVADPDFVATFDDSWIGDLANAILEINTLKEEERKNSDE